MNEIVPPQIIGSLRSNSEVAFSVHTMMQEMEQSIEAQGQQFTSETTTSAKVQYLPDGTCLSSGHTAQNTDGQMVLAADFYVDAENLYYDYTAPQVMQLRLSLAENEVLSQMLNVEAMKELFAESYVLSSSIDGDTLSFTLDGAAMSGEIASMTQALVGSGQLDSLEIHTYEVEVELNDQNMVEELDMEIVFSATAQGIDMTVSTDTTITISDVGQVEVTFPPEIYDYPLGSLG